MASFENEGIHEGVNKCPSESLELGQRSFLVNPHQATVPSDIRRQNCRQSPLDLLAAQDAPRIGKFNANYSRLVARCPAWPMSEMGQRRRFDDVRAESAFPPLATFERTSRDVSNGQNRK